MGRGESRSLLSEQRCGVRCLRLGAGQQEVSATALAQIKLDASALLFAATGNTTYQTYFDANYNANSLTSSLAGYVGPWNLGDLDALLTYATASNATAAVASAIKTNMLAGLNGGDNFPAYTGSKGSYVAYLAQFVWGSNQTQASQGLLFTLVPTYGLDPTKNTAAMTAAERHVHYFHGVNPLSKVFLSNVNAIGASNSVTSFYHSGLRLALIGASSACPSTGPHPAISWEAPIQAIRWMSAAPRAVGPPRTTRFA